MQHTVVILLDSAGPANTVLPPENAIVRRYHNHRCQHVVVVVEGSERACIAR